MTDRRPATASPPYPTRAMAAAVVWIGLGVAATASILAEFVLSSHFEPTQDGVLGRVVISTPLVALGVLILTGVLGRTTTLGAASLVFGALVAGAFLVSEAQHPDMIDPRSGRVRVEVLAIPAFAVVLLVAGFLATSGGANYRRWWRAKRRK